MVLPIPELLDALVLARRWPSSQTQELQQHFTSLVSAERIAAFAPEETRLYLHKPPFRTVAHLLALGEEFWSWPCAAPQGIDPEKAIAIADFELGSDAPIILDYRGGSPPPRVLRLRWVDGTRPENNEWVEIAPSFARFVEMLGI